MKPSQYVSVNVYSVCHLTKSIHGNNMFSSCCKLALGNNRFAEVYTTKENEHRIDLREWKNDKGDYFKCGTFQNICTLFRHD